MNTSIEPTSAANSRPGRPRALDHVKQREIIASVMAGFTIERAARYVGCASSTIRRECRRNPEFGRELERALFSAELAPLRAVREAARKYWRAGVWLLERLNPEQFAKRAPGHLGAEQFQAITAALATFLAQEVSNPEERQRIYDKINALEKSMERMVLLNADTPPRKRSRRRAHELSPATVTLLAEVQKEVELRNSRAIARQNVNQ
jgi:hypothetical protein